MHEPELNLAHCLLPVLTAELKISRKNLIYVSKLSISFKEAPFFTIRKALYILYIKVSYFVYQDSILLIRISKTVPLFSIIHNDSFKPVLIYVKRKTSVLSVTCEVHWIQGRIVFGSPIFVSLAIKREL